MGLPKELEERAAQYQGEIFRLLEHVGFHHRGESPGPARKLPATSKTELCLYFLHRQRSSGTGSSASKVAKVASSSRLRKKSSTLGGRCFSADVNCVLSTGFSP